MNIPFTTEQFFNVMKNYNIDVWPMQVLLNIFALTTVLFAMKKIKLSDKIISFILSFFWLWMGLVYHVIYFTSINKAAYVFGIFFIIQGILFFVFGVLKNDLSFQLKSDLNGIAGAILILYALLIYPVLGAIFGHTYPSNPTFGLPCPTTIFTFGILLCAIKKIQIYILIIPLLWSLMGFSAALNMGVKEDFGLVIAGILGFILILIKNKRIRKELTFSTI